MLFIHYVIYSLFYLFIMLFIDFKSINKITQNKNKNKIKIELNV
jgi:hypothetical protein